MRMNSELVQWTVEYLVFHTKQLEYRWAPACIETTGSYCTDELHAGSCFTKNKYIGKNPKE